MDELTSSLQPLTIGDASGKFTEPAKGLASSLDASTAPQLSLEQLPVELQQLIMSQAPTLSSLSALVHASPQLHRVYVENRTPILRSVLAQALNGMLVDALGAYHSGKEFFQRVREESLLWAFVEEYESKYTSTATDWMAALSLEDIIHLHHFHTSVIEPLADRYASWALASLPIPSTNEQTRKQPLSNTERCRIQRAMYRLQIFCSAWEIEEILCFHRFAEDVHSNVFKQVAWDLNPENPRYRHLDISDINENLVLVWNAEAEDGSINKNALNAVLRSGLKLLSDIMKTKDHEQLVIMTRAAVLLGMGEHDAYYENGWIDDAVREDIQEARRERWYSHRDSAQDWRQKTPFDGDRLDSPPAAWVQFWHGEYSNLAGDHIPEELRRWGFVMWDAGRLNSRAEARIDYYAYFGWDPREEFYHPSVIDPWKKGNVISDPF
ncbi:hypothetical protein SLS63_013464 [Diaporthe eres]|uniref:F-box domain-containing protein n=1 Tax=Diaporthe eres TaxID=83184 RepID=A0ABR1NNG5_DIAER